jgi:hypothetical protein
MNILGNLKIMKIVKRNIFISLNNESLNINLSFYKSIFNSSHDKSSNVSEKWQITLNVNKYKQNNI